MNLVDLDAFVRVAREGSLTAAAKDLGVPKSTVSRRVARLEDALGVALLKRTGRAVALTPTGQRLYERTSGSLREIDDVARELRDGLGAPAGILRLTAPPDIGAAGWFAELLTSFRARYPDVRIELDLTNRVVDLIAESYDVAIRARGATGSDALVAKRLVPGPDEPPVRVGLYASAAYLAARGTPTRLSDLADHDLIAHPAATRGGAWTLFGPDGAREVLPVAPAVLVNDFAMVAELAHTGAGVALLPGPSALPWVRTGGLVPVLPDWGTETGGLHLVWPSTRHLAARVRAFVDHAVEHVRAM